MVVLEGGGVLAVAEVIAVARLGGVPLPDVPIVAHAAGVARVVLIQAHGLRRGRPVARAAPIAEVARQEARAHVPAR